jgi:hypothetical protein
MPLQGTKRTVIVERRIAGQYWSSIISQAVGGKPKTTSKRDELSSEEVAEHTSLLMLGLDSPFGLQT